MSSFRQLAGDHFVFEHLNLTCQRRILNDPLLDALEIVNSHGLMLLRSLETTLQGCLPHPTDMRLLGTNIGRHRGRQALGAFKAPTTRRRGAWIDVATSLGSMRTVYLSICKHEPSAEMEWQQVAKSSHDRMRCVGLSERLP